MNNNCKHTYACRIIYTDLDTISTKEDMSCALNEFRLNTQDCRQRSEGYNSGHYKSEYEKRVSAITIKDKLEADCWWVFNYCPECGTKLDMENL